ncbi:MAG: di-trans,poly-cis-decaprenylcistransferase [Spirochaetales bacterium]|nr:di-trans,poly-cis-decaprenylcistransferase [Spirochaetales bacterium]
MDNDDYLDPGNIPAHVGIIMDGNGRWALSRNKPRTFGHNEGLKAAKRTVKAAVEIGIKFISLYTFSTENWKRTEEEVSFLMGLITAHLRREYDFYRENSIKVVHSGDLTSLPPAVQKEIDLVEKDTETFDNLTVNLAINYGGKDEIIRAVNKWRGLSAGNADITAEELEQNLDHPEIPPVDLVIRTAGEKRLSNFLLWESAYSEFYFTEKLWPDWDKPDMVAAIREYQKRDRKFGGIHE